ncbi:hypothetical protein MJ575_24420 [Klebsiella pneumoniae]|nr:hypothetical protein MJ575_24420 [Klebsiella pneumoniae]
MIGCLLAASFQERRRHRAAIKQSLASWVCKHRYFNHRRFRDEHSADDSGVLYVTGD